MSKFLNIILYHSHASLTVNCEVNGSIVEYHLRGRPLYSNQTVSVPGGSVLQKWGLIWGIKSGKYPIRGANIWNLYEVLAKNKERTVNWMAYQGCNKQSYQSRRGSRKSGDFWLVEVNLQWNGTFPDVFLSFHLHFFYGCFWVPLLVCDTN